ncbi:putative lipid-binding transport protein (Tim44 family) [Sphingomonas vulcanisoli]|uniref:Lipid-binding transport protein (Tim44 family) n=1 Tax=Sphingomonas vulcanisoli TaxID=1658060 RepID=A0ABX0TRR7_9SPHN|nr:putative lipid-binding transport protein (Tim44 family) [Sphingomonas vulcanisoli]
MSTIIILALVFVFVALRLWSVLGRRTGHEQPLAKPESVPSSRGLFARASVEPAPVPAELPGNAPGATAGLRAIAAADNTFDLARFVDGARAAYKMILEAYWAGDEDRLKELVDGEVAEAFAATIQDRKAEGLVLDNRLVSIDATHIEDARVDGQTAHIRVRFDADVAAVTRDAEGNVVAGSLEDAVPTHDVWTFSRALKASDPNWTLTETDEAA